MAATSCTAPAGTRDGDSVGHPLLRHTSAGSLPADAVMPARDNQPFSEGYGTGPGPKDGDSQPCMRLAACTSPLGHGSRMKRHASWTAGWRVKAQAALMLLLISQHTQQQGACALPDAMAAAVWYVSPASSTRRPKSTPSELFAAAVAM